MSIRRFSSSDWSLATAAIPWRGVYQRFSFVIFVALAMLLIILSKTQPIAVSAVRVKALDTLAPILDAIARPMVVVENATAAVKETVYLRTDNKKLREENAHMVEWQNAVISLEKENKELRELLRFKAEPGLSYISARVIADTGESYARGLIITAGKIDGVHEGMAAMTGEGLIGRVVEVGDWSSRVMLVTDLNSRVPVTIAQTGDRAIMAGDNTSKPKLLFLPREASLSNGARVVTSGHGGIFPPNLQAGILKEGKNGEYEVVPVADMGRVTYVRLVDFGLKGRSLNPIENAIRAEGNK